MLDIKILDSTVKQISLEKQIAINRKKIKTENEKINNISAKILSKNPNFNINSLYGKDYKDYEKVLNSFK